MFRLSHERAKTSVFKMREAAGKGGSYGQWQDLWQEFEKRRTKRGDSTAEPGSFPGLICRKKKYLPQERGVKGGSRTEWEREGEERNSGAGKGDLDAQMYTDYEICVQGTVNGS